MSVLDLALTKGIGSPFDVLTLERIEKQSKQFSKPVGLSLIPSVGLFLIPLVIIAYLVFKK